MEIPSRLLAIFEKLWVQAAHRMQRPGARRFDDGGSRVEYVAARRTGVTKHMNLFQEPARTENHEDTLANNSPLAPLFEADRLAIIGASDRNHYAVNIIKNLQNMGFDQSQIIPINPGRPEVFGLKAYASIADVPGEIPLAVIAVNNKAVVSVVEETGRKGVKAA